MAGQQLHKMQSNLTTERRAATNRQKKKKRVQWLIEALCFVSSSVLADSLVFEIRFFAKRQNVGGNTTESTHITNEQQKR